MKILKTVLLWLPAVLYLGLIYYLSSKSMIRFPPMAPDYVLHALEYLVLFILIVRAFNSGLRRKVTASALFSGIVFSLIYAVLDEVHQLYVPGRRASPLDFFSDAVGVVIGIAFIYFIQRCLGVAEQAVEKVPGSE